MTATLYTRDGAEDVGNLVGFPIPNDRPSVLVVGALGARKFRTSELHKELKAWLLGEANRGIAHVRKYCRDYDIKVPRLRGEAK